MAESATAFLSLMSLVGVWFLGGVWHRKHRIDVLRQDLFALRDELFDLAASGKLSFDHPAYGQLRSALNGFIRSAHRMNIMHFGLFFLFSRANLEEVDDGFQTQWDKAIYDLDKEVRDELEKYLLRMHLTLLKHFVFSSAFTIVVPVAAWASAKICYDKMLHILKGPLNDMDSAALACGGHQFAD